SRGAVSSLEIEARKRTREPATCKSTLVKRPNLGMICPITGGTPMPKAGRPHSGKWVAYYRVSTERQGDSGLGLDAQRKLVSDYLNGGNWVLSAEFTEVESGKRSDRPQLALALAMCKRLRAKLICAKLDRLSRNVSFISALLDSGVDFVAA